MLDADQHRVHPAGAPLGVVLHGHLRLPVGTRPAQGPVAPGGGELAGQPVGQLDGGGHQLRGLVAGEADHHPLVAGATRVDPLGDVGGLLVDGHEDAAGLEVEAELGSGVTDVADGLADDARDVDVGLGADLAEDQDRARAECRLTGDPAQGVLGQDAVQNRVTDLVGHLVRMAVGHRLRGEEPLRRPVGVMRGHLRALQSHRRPPARLARRRPTPVRDAVDATRLQLETASSLAGSRLDVYCIQHV